mmetsp:Transcript_13392/g.28430  ORF Transcript_13392/g.28430 Transcript_13392/m.28430 type:complete len:281 (-) Transcript_13392:939-1781(-)
MAAPKVQVRSANRQVPAEAPAPAGESALALPGRRQLDADPHARRAGEGHHQRRRPRFHHPLRRAGPHPQEREAKEGALLALRAQDQRGRQERFQLRSERLGRWLLAEPRRGADPLADARVSRAHLVGRARREARHRLSQGGPARRQLGPRDLILRMRTAAAGLHRGRSSREARRHRHGLVQSDEPDFARLQAARAAGHLSAQGAGCDVIGDNSRTTGRHRRRQSGGCRAARAVQALAEQAPDEHVRGRRRGHDATGGLARCGGTVVTAVQLSSLPRRLQP